MNRKNYNWIEKKSKIVIAILLVLSGSLAVAGVIIMTDFGQLFGIDKSIIVTYFKHNVAFSALSLVLFGIAIYLNRQVKLMKRSLTITLSVMMVIALLSSKYVTPYLLFRTHQYDAVYKNVKDTKDYLEASDIVYVIDLNGETKAFPQKYIWQTHVIGSDFRGEDVVFTYCVLTNLPTPYYNNLEGKPMDLKVLAQTNNNLLLWETNSGEIITQINNSCEFSSRKLEPVPVLEMNWEAYKQIYPEGKIFYNEFDTFIERMLAKSFSLEQTYNGDDWMFETANMDDKRLHSKEQIIGLKDNSDAIAITKDFIKNKKVYNTKVGSKNIVLAYYPEYNIIAAFDRYKDGKELTIKKIDIFGNTPEYGQLDRVYIYNSVLWAVWVHYHPQTILLK